MAKRKTVGQFEVEELACKITGLDYDEIDADETIIDDKLVEVFGCTLRIKAYRYKNKPIKQRENE